MSQFRTRLLLAFHYAFSEEDFNRWFELNLQQQPQGDQLLHFMIGASNVTQFQRYPYYASYYRRDWGFQIMQAWDNQNTMVQNQRALLRARNIQTNMLVRSLAEARAEIAFMDTTMANLRTQTATLDTEMARMRSTMAIIEGRNPTLHRRSGSAPPAVRL